MGIDPKDVKEGDCLKCGQSEAEHHNYAPFGAAFVGLRCTNYIFTPKPPTPKAKPGVWYRHHGYDFDRIGLADGSLGLLVHQREMLRLPFTADWQEVPNE